MARLFTMSSDRAFICFKGFFRLRAEEQWFKKDVWNKLRSIPLIGGVGSKAVWKFFCCGTKITMMRLASNLQECWIDFKFSPCLPSLFLENADFLTSLLFPELYLSVFLFPIGFYSPCWVISWDVTLGLIFIITSFVTFFCKNEFVKVGGFFLFCFLRRHSKECVLNKGRIS